MPDFIEVYDNALSDDLCKRLRETFDSSPHVHTGRTGQGVEPDKKVSLDLALNNHAEYAGLLEEVTDVTRRYLLEYFKKYHFALIAPVAFKVRHPQTGQPVNLTSDNFAEVAGGKEEAYMRMLYRLGPIQAQKYAAGKGNYNYWHCEVYPQKNSKEALHRSLLFMFYLNDVEEGGETDFYYQERSIQPAQGRMVVAPAYFTHTHRGRTPVSSDKYILTSWVLLTPGEQLYA